MRKINRLRFSANNFGVNLIMVDHSNGDQETVELDIPQITKDKEMTKELINGLANILSSLACHL